MNHIPVIWRQAVVRFRQHGLRGALATMFPDDRNVTERIQFDYPPTFQPGYVGPDYQSAGIRVVFLGVNPGEGTSESSRLEDAVLGGRLEQFAEDELSFDGLSEFLASHLVH